jgi:chemotaxis protein methyltransferase CheR
MEDGRLEPRQFNRFCAIAYAHAGIALRHGKEPLVAARVAKRLRALGIGTADEYLQYLEADATGEEVVSFLDAITTNFTSFFREREHFDLLAHAMSEWTKAGQQRLRIWCAASSSGEEPYSLAITTLEAASDRIVDTRILATDISTKVLAQASEGIYEDERLSPLSDAQLRKYFVELKQRRGDHVLYQVKPQLRDRIVFKRLNLSEHPFPMRGPLDAVFCRNVMIYFDQPIRQRLVTEIEHLLKPGGLLVVGHAESLTGLESGLRSLRPSVYQKGAR